MSWFHLARQNRLPTSIVGGVPARTFRCPEPGCPVVDRDPETVLLHAFSEHGRDRRVARRVA